MEYKSNVKELLVRLKLIRANIAAGVFSDALVAGLNAGMGAMLRRIFNQSLDANGVSLGGYSEAYGQYRANRGRQTERKDLQFTGSLKAAIAVVTVNNTNAQIRFTDSDSADIGRWQEQQVFNIRNNSPANTKSGGRAPIFELNADERDITKTMTRELLNQKFNF